MVLIRYAEEAIGDYRRDGVIKTPCHLYIGQEAIAVGVCDVLKREDTVWGTHRSHGHYLAKGANLSQMMAEVFGRFTGCSKGRGGSMHLVSPKEGILGTVPIVAATIPIAVGAALAYSMKREARVSVPFFGDGSTEEGHFFESMNLAAIYKLPVVFVLENNLQASHMHLLERRTSDNLDRLGDFYNMPSERVDGNDVQAVRDCAEKAVSRARRGDGPSIIEARTFRWRGHVDWREDDDVGLLREDTLSMWKPAKCPIELLKRQMLARGVEQNFFDEADGEVLNNVKDAVEYAVTSPVPDDTQLLTHVFVNSER
ncbi:MAG: thiamine pyrophosphate-dependent dehydrogenase E1 component subunit alpha [Bacteroidetes bacterium]|nr:thiamine pyrophosphate-dependent dehydrogenase E1 component subunit alpha [Bacteroidota bacterium]